MEAGLKSVCGWRPPLLKDQPAAMLDAAVPSAETYRLAPLQHGAGLGCKGLTFTWEEGCHHCANHCKTVLWNGPEQCI